MTVYWVDPYIEADIGGIHGTTDTASRNGTYAAPWAITDIIGSSVTDTNSKIYGLSNGDEVRLKGLAMSSYLIDAGTFYSNSSFQYARKSGETAPSAWSSARSARAAAARNCCIAAAAKGAPKPALRAISRTIPRSLGQMFTLERGV